MSVALFLDGLHRRPYSSSWHCVKTLPSGASFAVLSYWIPRAYCESIAISQEAAKFFLLRISCSVLWLCKHWTLRHAVSLCQEAAKLVFRGSPPNCMHVQVPKYFGEFEFILTHFLNKLCCGAFLVATGLLTPRVKLLSIGNKPEKERKAKMKTVLSPDFSYVRTLLDYMFCNGLSYYVRHSHYTCHE
jgi:hypothetical protein